MQVSYPNASVLTGMSASTSTSLAPGPNAGAASLEVEAPLSNPGNTIDAEASEPMPAHVFNGAPQALAAPAPSAGPVASGQGTGEPASLWAFGVSKAQGA